MIVRRASFSGDNPEVRDRLRRAWRSQTEKLVVLLLPDDYPLWPDIDRLAEPLECSWTDVRVFVKPYTNADWKKHQELMSRTGLPYIHPSYRNATRSWAAFELGRSANPEYVREMLARGIICEQMGWERNGRPLAELLHDEPEAARDLFETYPEIMNRRYYDGRRGR